MADDRPIGTLLRDSSRAEYAVLNDEGTAPADIDTVWRDLAAGRLLNVRFTSTVYVGCPKVYGEIRPARFNPAHVVSVIEHPLLEQK